MSKDLTKSMGLMSHQIEDINKVIDIFERKSNQLEILELKFTGWAQ